MEYNKGNFINGDKKTATKSDKNNIDDRKPDGCPNLLSYPENYDYYKSDASNNDKPDNTNKYIVDKSLGSKHNMYLNNIGGELQYNYITQIIKEKDYLTKSMAGKLFTKGKSDNSQMIRFVCISDTHSKHLKVQLPKGDVLIHGGDFTNFGSPKEVDCFNIWLSKQDFKHKIVIAGNHEFTFDLEKEAELKPHLIHMAEFSDYARKSGNKKINFKEIKSRLTGGNYLENQGIGVYGFNIYGTPYHPIHLDAAFQRPNKRLQQIFDEIPTDTDILISHGPPRNILDTTKGKINAGDEYLKYQILSRIKPLYHLFGHIHESFGGAVVDNTIFLNGSIGDRSYKATHLPIVFDLLSLTTIK